MGGDVVVTAFQSACGLVNLVTPTAAVVMGALALGRIPYEKWLKFVWKLILLFLLLTGLLLVLAPRCPDRTAVPPGRGGFFA